MYMYFPKMCILAYLSCLVFSRPRYCAGNRSCSYFPNPAHVYPIAYRFSMATYYCIFYLSKGAECVVCFCVCVSAHTNAHFSPPNLYCVSYVDCRPSANIFCTQDSQVLHLAFVAYRGGFSYSGSIRPFVQVLQSTLSPFHVSRAKGLAVH